MNSWGNTVCCRHGVAVCLSSGPSPIMPSPRGAARARTVASRDVALPSELSMHFRTWGPAMLARASAAFQKWSASDASATSCHSALLPARALRVATDCSGCDAPIWALRSLGVAHTQAWACDIAEHCRKFIAANSPSGMPILANMLRRDNSMLPPHDVYVVGFSCKPWSTLHHQSKLWREPEAKTFGAVLKLLRQRRPRLAVLENVTGIRRVMPSVMKRLRSLIVYDVHVLHLDPRDFGEPVHRSRVYFVLVLKDGARVQGESEAGPLIEGMLHAMHQTVKVGMESRMLPNDHPLVADVLRNRMRRVCQGRAGRMAGSVACPAPGISPSADDLLLTSPRMRNVWETAAEQNQGSPGLAVDVSQSLHRAPVIRDGSCPCVTPRALICVRAVGRVVTLVEKLLLNGFPLDRLCIPVSISDTHLSSLGGNTMHVHCVAAALLIGLALIDWERRVPKMVPASGAATKRRRPRRMDPLPRPKAQRGSAGRGFGAKLEDLFA